MKKRSLKPLALKKTAISNLEKSKGGAIDSQISCYGSCLPNNTCYVNCQHEPVPQQPLPFDVKIESLFYWLCPN